MLRLGPSGDKVPWVEIEVCEIPLSQAPRSMSVAWEPYDHGTNRRHQEANAMNWLHIGLIGAIVFSLHSLQQIKMILKDKGHHVDLMTGWLDDYKKFKTLTLEETDEATRYKYQRILNGLYLALAGLVFIPLLMIMGK
jgi:hypothetical protein